MTRRQMPLAKPFPVLHALLLCVLAPLTALAQPPAAIAAFDLYSGGIESRLAHQHASQETFLPATSPLDLRLRRGDLIVEQLTPSSNPPSPSAMLHHWRGTAFAPGASAHDLERLLRNFNAYPQTFSPQVLQAAILNQNGDCLQASMRVRQHHVLTVVMDTTYNIVFAHLDPQHGSSISRSTHIAEIASPGTPAEHPLSPADEHGFLWRLNTYWTWEERNGGLYLQVETISLTRSIPTGLAWAVRPYVESVPRESLEFTLRSICAALQRGR